MPTEINSESPNTMLECPNENQNPTDNDGLPSPNNSRVVLSMATMWSASNAWRMPSA
jgi:hypothetical protein